MGIVLGALLGLLLGGMRGLLIGAVLGFAAGQVLRLGLVSSLRMAGTTWIDSTFSVMGALCKADRAISRAEINAAEQIFAQLGLSQAQRESAKAAFNRGKEPQFDLDAAVDTFAALARGRGPLIQLFLQIQCMAVAADGTMHPAEHQMLVRIARRLGLTESDVSRLEALLRAAGVGGARPGEHASQDRLTDAYQALDLTPDATDTEVKRRYRKLMSDNHPDRLTARGLPESMRAVAEERSREINTAYDLIKEARGLT